MWTLTESYHLLSLQLEPFSQGILFLVLRGYSTQPIVTHALLEVQQLLQAVVLDGVGGFAPEGP